MQFDRICLSRLRLSFICIEMQARRLPLGNSAYDFRGFIPTTRGPADHARHFFFEPEQKGRSIVRPTIRPTRLSFVIGNELPSARQHRGNRWCASSSMSFIRATFKSFSKVCSWNRRPKSGISVRVFATFRNDEK